MMTNEEVHFGLKFKHYCISVDLKYVKKRRIFTKIMNRRKVSTLGYHFKMFYTICSSRPANNKLVCCFNKAPKVSQAVLINYQNKFGRFSDQQY